MSFERNHGIARVATAGSENIQERNRSRDLVSAQESKDGKLCETAVVELCHKASLLGLGRHVLVESEWIIQIQDGVNILTERLEGRVLSWLSSLGVMRKDTASAALIPKFQHGDDRKDLPLGSEGNSIPLRFGSQICRRVGSW